MRRARNADGGLSEAAWQSQVEALARYYQWKVFHAPDNKPTTTASGRAARQRVSPGFPDLILLRGPELIVAELKTDRGRMGPGQDEWLDAWREFASCVDFASGTEHRVYGRDATGVRAEVYVWRPSDFDAVNTRLAAGSTVARVV